MQIRIPVLLLNTKLHCLMQLIQEGLLELSLSFGYFYLAEDITTCMATVHWGTSAE